ncbi:deoxyribonuclease IV [Metamycoplasma neophronis]|uniref:Probable endonuclease 4 n=1 Tax=Metamycoplasma neophronis TaxID=872983 RepID=A0ABY2YZX9_9BACT|nr:deoxyribonuclease IV [Metamycoplasma neophronis]TPR54044.1 deoxyribonuclease IV [Metamycoplasma neophronis]
MIKLGSHVSFKKPNYLVGAIEESLDNGANCAMIYLGAPQTTLRVATDQYKYNEYLINYQNDIKPEDIVVHAPYIVNPANPDKQGFAISFLSQEINRMNTINAKYLVLHPGSSMEYTRKEALDTLINSLKAILAQTKDVIICLETMAGKGSQVCSSFEDLLYVIKGVNSDRVAICLDTCHVFDAGYDITKYEDFKNYLISNDYLKHIKVIHLNDSLNPLGSHKDRHANIDKGYIGLETIKKFVFDKDFDNIPIILETPYINNKSPYKEEIALILNKDSANEDKLF